MGRAAFDWTQAQLAVEADVSAGVIRDYERRRRIGAT